mmetsp:Transcript_25733/g.72355  ORF Transcript_25733/g.72355 Transcript_25733/m.72355 type:complete len:377 (-) Transcript_25733:708-1838(-)
MMRLILQYNSRCASSSSAHNSESPQNLQVTGRFGHWAWCSSYACGSSDSWGTNAPHPYAQHTWSNAASRFCTLPTNAWRIVLWRAACASMWPRLTQMSKGVRPSSPFMLGSAPRNNSNSTHFGLSLSAANLNGVQPFLPSDLRLTSAPLSSKASTTSARPLQIAIVRAVLPHRFSMSTSGLLFGRSNRNATAKITSLASLRHFLRVSIDVSSRAAAINGVKPVDGSSWSTGTTPSSNIWPMRMKSSFRKASSRASTAALWASRSFLVRTLSLLDWIPARTACRWPCQASSAAISVNDLGVSSSYTQPTPWRQSIIRRSDAPNLAHSSTLYFGLGSSGCLRRYGKWASGYSTVSYKELPPLSNLRLLNASKHSWLPL